ncbi:MAG: hypothetical protein R3B53_02675 [Candidatus Paceibacterota bacterium]
MQPLDPEILEKIANMTGCPIWKIQIDLGKAPTVTCPAVNQREAMLSYHRAVSGSEKAYVALKKWDEFSIQAIESAQTVLAVYVAINFSSQSTELRMAADKKIDAILRELIKSAETVEELMEIYPSCPPDSQVHSSLAQKLYNMMMMSVPTRK